MQAIKVAHCICTLVASGMSQSPSHFQPASSAMLVGSCGLQGCQHTEQRVRMSVLNNAIKLFRKFLPARLPKKIADIYKLHWQPVYVMMEEGIGDEVPGHLTTAIVNNLFEQGTEYLQRRVSYIFQNEKLHHHDWVIATWARYLSRTRQEQLTCANALQPTLSCGSETLWAKPAECCHCRAACVASTSLSTSFSSLAGRDGVKQQ